MIDVRPYIDNRNAKLWEELNNSDLSITIEKENRELGYGCCCQGKKVTIKVQLADPDPAAFAHELLHIKLRKEGVFAGGCLKEVILEDQILKDIFTKDTLDNIANNMDHVKILPWFLAMGYKNSEFVADYGEWRFEREWYNDFYLLYQMEIKQFIDRFVGTYAAMKADNNPTHIYDECYPLFQSIDGKLYAIVEKFWEDWLQYDVEKKREIWESDYGPIILEFVNSLSEYVKSMEY